MTAPYGVPAPNGQGGWGPPPGPPPGQATFTVPPVQQGGQATVVRETGWSGFPVAAIPPMPPDPRFAQPMQGALPGPQYQPGQPVQTQHPQPGTQPGQTYQPPQGYPQGQPTTIDPSTILSGPGIPAELQGLTMAQAIAMYGNMRNLAMQLSQRGGQQPPQAPQGPPQQQLGQPTAPVQGQPGQPAAFDWRNPAAAFGQIIEQALDRRLRPMEENAIVTQATNARNVVAQEVGPQRFAQIEASVMQYLHGADPRALTDPELWRVAVRTAIGDAALRGQQPSQAPNGTIPVVRQQGGATPFVPGMPNPAPQLSSFFTETPQAGGQAAQGVTLTPQQMWFADQMNISYADYAAYSQGVPPVNPQQGGQR